MKSSYSAYIMQYKSGKMIEKHFEQDKIVKIEENVFSNAFFTPEDAIAFAKKHLPEHLHKNIKVKEIK